MKIKITRFTDKQNWYSDKIGKTFTHARKAVDGGYTLFDKEHLMFHVNSQDCIVLNTNETEDETREIERNFEALKRINSQVKRLVNSQGG